MLRSASACAVLGPHSAPLATQNKQLAPLAALAEAAIPAATGLLGIVAGFLVATLRKDSDTAKQ